MTSDLAPPTPPSASTSARPSPRPPSSTPTTGGSARHRPHPTTLPAPDGTATCSTGTTPAWPRSPSRTRARRDADGARLLLRRRRPADRGRRQRGAGDRRGRAPGRAVQRRQGGAGAAGGLGRAAELAALRTPSPTWCCSSAAPTAATPARSWRDAAALADGRWPGPVVVAGNVEAQPDAVAAALGRRHAVRARRQRGAAHRRARARLGAGRRSARCSSATSSAASTSAAAPTPAADFAALVRGATPDVVLTGVELLARGLDDEHRVGDVVVVDVGGATTDVHCVVELDPEEAAGLPARWSPRRR